MSRKFTGTIKTVTISKTATGKYYASVLVENDETLPTPTTIEPNLTLGIDLGISHLLNLSDGSRTYTTKSHISLSVKTKRQAMHLRFSGKKHGKEPKICQSDL